MLVYQALRPSGATGLKALAEGPIRLRAPGVPQGTAPVKAPCCCWIGGAGGRGWVSREEARTERAGRAQSTGDDPGDGLGGFGGTGEVVDVLRVWWAWCR